METVASDPLKKTGRSARLRRLKWVVRVVALLGAAAAIRYAIALGLALHAESRLNADIALRRSQGQKVLKEDFAHAPIPDSINAVHFIHEARSALHLSDDEEDFLFNLPTDEPLAESDLKKLSGILQSNRAVMENAHLARLCPQCDWQIDLSPTPLLGKVSLPYLNATRDVARLIACDIQFKHQLGEDAAVVESLRDLLGLSRALDCQCMVVSHLCADGVMYVAVDKCRHVAGALRMAGANEPKGATRQQVNDLIAELLDDGPQKAAIVECWTGERMEALDAALFLAHSVPVFHRATFYSEGDWLMRDAETMLSAASAPSWESCQAILAGAPAPTSKTDHPVAELLAPPWRRLPEWEFRSRGERRTAALFLAIRLYALDHDDRLPPSLDALTPAYLKFLPPDPFASDGSTFRYRSTAPAVLYSVARNGKDDGGDPTSVHGDVWDAPDAVFPIHTDAKSSSK